MHALGVDPGTDPDLVRRKGVGPELHPRSVQNLKKGGGPKADLVLGKMLWLFCCLYYSLGQALIDFAQGHSKGDCSGRCVGGILFVSVQITGLLTR